MTVRVRRRLTSTGRSPKTASRIGRIGALALVLPLVAACGGESTASSEGGPEKVEVGVLPIVTLTPIALGVEKGFFEEEGLDVELQMGQGGAALIPALVSGQQDFAFSNNVSLLLARSQGLPLTIVSAASSAGVDPSPIDEALVVPKGSPYDSPDDLAGATVAVNTLNNIVEVANRVTLEKAGVDTDSVDFVEVAFPDMPSALAKGHLDAAHIAEPFLTQAVEAGAKIIAHPYREVRPDIHVSSWFATEKFAAEDPETVEKFVRGLEKSREYAAAHPDEIRAFIPEFLGLDPKLADKIALGNWPEGLPSEESLAAWRDAAVDAGVLEEGDMEDIAVLLNEG